MGQFHFIIHRWVIKTHVQHVSVECPFGESTGIPPRRVEILFPSSRYS
jgi:hypothetical protein